MIFAPRQWLFLFAAIAASGGNVGASEVARSGPDGNKFLMGTPGTAGTQAIDNLPSAMPHIKAGKLFAPGVSGARANSQLPDVAPIASILPGYAAESWFVLMAPAGTPPAIVNRLSAEVDKILKKPELIARFKGLRAEPVGGTPDQLGKPITAETGRWSQVVKSSGAKIG